MYPKSTGMEYVGLWSPILRTMFTVQKLYNSRAPSAPRVTMIIDEAGQLGNFEALRRAFTFGRGAGVQVWALFQDVGQIVRNFGAPALQGFMGSSALRQFCGVRDYQTAQMVSSMLGNETLEYDDSLRQADAKRQKMNAAISIMNGSDPFSAYADMKYHAYPPGKVVEMVQARGFPRFKMHDHTELWRQLDAKNPGKGYGREGDYNGTWVWFDRWVERVVEYCEGEGDRFR